MSSQESHTHPEPYLVYLDPSSDSTQPLSSASSFIRVVELDQVAEQNATPYVELSVKRDDPDEHRPRFFIQHPVLMKIDIPSIFKPEDMLYLKERYGFPHSAVLSSPREGERADSVRDRWINFYEIPFKLALRLPFHCIINMVLNYFNLVPEQLMLNGWRYLLGLIVLSERGRACFIPLARLTLGFALYRLKEADPIPECIPLHILEVPCTHILEGCIRLLYGEPTDPLWSCYLTFDMGKMKVQIPTDVELAEKERKKEKKAARKASGSSTTKDPKPTPSDMGKAPEPERNLGSRAITLFGVWTVAEIVNNLVTRHNYRVILKGMTFKDISHEVEQCTLELAQDCRYLIEAVIKTDSAWKKKTSALNNLTVTNKSLEEKTDLKLVEKEEELRNLRLDFSRIASERDELEMRAMAWPSKKKTVCRKGVEDAFLKAKRQMIRRFKAREVNWPTPELSEDEDGEASEISSNEDELEGNTEVEKTLLRDSFMEVMDAVRFKGTGPTANIGEASSVAQPNQGDLL
ncbi:hypothetical protein FNV43_RR05673 [Rhamnella rubrinervis]|uniref:Uncharacterized protein n=1 Tax=Rhamnella rubrinervis TaxID=2594499 RepID=A0A8K0MRU4_9ROSA|nr:hypothetical protein FNV43_RR05673 [Rhamnella rubrinervis]